MELSKRIEWQRFLGEAIAKQKKKARNEFYTLGFISQQTKRKLKTLRENLKLLENGNTKANIKEI